MDKELDEAIANARQHAYQAMDFMDSLRTKACKGEGYESDLSKAVMHSWGLENSLALISEIMLKEGK